MKNKLFYLISVACFLSYTSTFTSCVNGVDDEYLEQKLDGSENNKKGEELPDLNGDYSIEGDFDLEMICNGEVLEGKKVILTVDEKNETASFTFAAAQTDLETVIATSIPGGMGGLVSGWGLKYTGNSPIPGVKEIIVANVPLYRNGPDYYIFEGENKGETYDMTFKGNIDGDKMTVNFNYVLKNDKLVGTWDLADVMNKNSNDNSPEFSPLWLDWDSNVEVDLGSIQIELLGRPMDIPVKGKMNGLFVLLTGNMSPMIMNLVAGVNLGVEDIIKNMLQSVTAELNGNMYAIYSYSNDLTKPEWSGPEGMPHNYMRYFYDREKPDEKIYIEVNPSVLISLIKSLAATATRSTRADLRDVAKELITLLVPLLEDGIPCEYKLEGDNMTINIDGVVMRDILIKLMVVLNDPDVQSVLEGPLSSLGDQKEMVYKLIKNLPYALKYHDGDNESNYTGECKYVKIGMKLVKAKVAN